MNVNWQDDQVIKGKPLTWNGLGSGILVVAGFVTIFALLALLAWIVWLMCQPPF